MPQAMAAAAAAAFSAATAAGATTLVATAAAIGAGVSAGVAALTFASGIGAALSAWGTVLALGSTVMSMMAKVPKPPSTGIQLDTKLDPNPIRTVAFGRTAVAGSMLYQAVSGVKKPDDNIRLARILGISVGPIEEIESFSVGNNPITWDHSPLDTLAAVVSVANTSADSKLWKGVFHQGWQVGDPANSQAPPIYTGTAMPFLDATSKLSGIAHATQHLDFLAEAYPTGDPFHGGYKYVVKGIKPYDPRRDSTYPGGSGPQDRSDPTTWEWSENPAIIGLNYAMGHFQNGHRVWGFGAPWETIDVAAFVNAANVADANGWPCGGEFSEGDDKFGVLVAILQACSATPVNQSGHLSCFVNAPMASVLTLTGEDVVGNVEISTSTAWRDRKNRIIPFYRSEESGWEIVGGNAVTDAGYVAEDGGETKSTEVSYPYCQSPTAAHQLAAYELVNSREFLQFTVTCSPRLAMAARVGDCITVDLPELGIVTQKCVVMSADINPDNWQITLVMRSETDAKHAYALGQSATAPPSPGLSGSYDPSAPHIANAATWFLAGTTVRDTANVAVPALVITGEVDDNNAKSVIIEYREYDTDATIDENWILHTEVPAEIDVPTRFTISGPIKGGGYYEASVRYRTVQEALSPRLRLGPVTAGTYLVTSNSVTYTDGSGTTLLQTKLNELANALAILNEDLENIDTGIPGFATPPSTAGYAEGDFYYNTTDRKLYSLTGGVWVTINTGMPYGANTPSAAGHVEGEQFYNETDGRIYRLTANAWVQIETGIPGFANAPSVASYKDGSTYFNQTDGKLYRKTNGAWDAIDAGVPSANTAPAVGNAGNLYLNTVDGKLYRSNGTAWTAAVPAVDITGQVSNAQIAANAVTSTHIANGSISTPKLVAGAITSNELAAGSVISGKIAAGIITANELATDSVIANKILAGAITTGKIAAGAVTANEIAASTITGGKIAGSTITGSNIAGLTITGSNIAAGTLTAGKLAAGTITANEIASNTITGGKIAGSTITGSNIQAGTILATHIGAGTITTNELGAGSVTTNNIFAGSITADKILGGAVTTVSWSEQGYGGTPGGGQVFALSHPTTVTYAPHVILFNVGITNFSGMNGMLFSVYRNGGLIANRAAITQGSFGYSFCWMCFDQPTAGTNTYQILAQLTPGSQSSPRLDYTNMLIMELKK